jgi:hypothetical protein
MEDPMAQLLGLAVLEQFERMLKRRAIPHSAFLGRIATAILHQLLDKFIVGNIGLAG